MRRAFLQETLRLARVSVEIDSSPVGAIVVHMLAYSGQARLFRNLDTAGLLGKAAA